MITKKIQAKKALFRSLFFVGFVLATWNTKAEANQRLLLDIDTACTLFFKNYTQKDYHINLFNTRLTRFSSAQKYLGNFETILREHSLNRARLNNWEQNQFPVIQGSSDVTYGQGGVIYAQQKIPSFMVSRKSRDFWDNIIVGNKISEDVATEATLLYSAGYFYTDMKKSNKAVNDATKLGFKEPQKIIGFIDNVKNYLKKSKEKEKHYFIIRDKKRIIEAKNEYEKKILQPRTANLDLITHGIDFMQDMIMKTENQNIMSDDFQQYIEYIVLGDSNKAFNMLFDEKSIFMQSLTSLVEDCNYTEKLRGTK